MFGGPEMRFAMKKITIFAGASALIITAAAYAAPMVGKMKMDVDGNGSVSTPEAASVSDARFAKMDADGNGQIDQADNQVRVKARFAEMDADHNGAITEAEFIAADAKRMVNRMERRDKRGEGRKGNRGGQEGGVGRWGKADTNGDKAISRAEYNAAQEARFAAKDTDNDGAISADEMKNALQKMRGGWRTKRGDAAPHAG